MKNGGVDEVYEVIAGHAGATHQLYGICLAVSSSGRLALGERFSQAIEQMGNGQNRVG